MGLKTDAVAESQMRAAIRALVASADPDAILDVEAEDVRVCFGILFYPYSLLVLFCSVLLYLGLGFGDVVLSTMMMVDYQPILTVTLALNLKPSHFVVS